MPVTPSRQRLAAVGAGGALGKQAIFFGAHLASQIVDVFHGVAADALAYHLGGIVDVLRPRQIDGLAEFLDPLFGERKHLIKHALLRRIVAGQSA